MAYDDLTFKIPVESADYPDCSAFVIAQCEEIVKRAIEDGRNQIFIHTNLRRGLPMENINKIAGPFVEAWAFEVFYDALGDGDNAYRLVNVEVGGRLTMADVLLQFERERLAGSGVLAEVDVKATAMDIASSGLSPNITSFARIRTAYVENPDYLFVVLSLKHRVYSKQVADTGMIDGVMEVVSYNAYDLKYLSDADLSYNPALGTGQIQVKDIHYVTTVHRTTWTFCQTLDAKYLRSGRNSFDSWIKLAKKNGWIKIDDPTPRPVRRRA